MSYSVKEIFYTLQGEGAHSGRPAVFCRFAGCNLWSGRERDRANAECNFCDTDFIGSDGPGGGQFASAVDLAVAIKNYWPGRPGEQARPFVVCTGGEPGLQLDGALIEALHQHGFTIAVETNGSCELPAHIDWVCVSPKANHPLSLTRGDELKLVYPQTDNAPGQFAQLTFNHFYLQPMDGPKLQENTQLAIEYCLKHPQWKLSLQSQKFIGIP